MGWNSQTREKLKKNKKKKFKVEKSENGVRNTIEGEKGEKLIDKESILRRKKK